MKINEVILKEGYQLRLERDKNANMLVLHIKDTRTGRRSEVRGKLGYETGGYDPNDSLHILLDKVGRSASVSDMMNGDVVHINPKHPQGPGAEKAANKITSEKVSAPQLNALEKVIDRVFSKIGIDVEFTNHFIQRVNDARNERDITVQDLGQLFAKEYKRWGKAIADLNPNAEAVMKDLSTDINIPFIIKKQGDDLQLIAKTVMAKKNFKTPNKKFPVERQHNEN